MSTAHTGRKSGIVILNPEVSCVMRLGMCRDLSSGTQKIEMEEDERVREREREKVRERERERDSKRERERV